MTRTFAWVTACIAAGSVSVLAQQGQPSQARPDQAATAKTITLQGCLEPRIGKAGAGPVTPVVPGGAGTTSATGSAGDPVSGTQGTPSQAGRPMPDQPAAAAATGNYVLRVTESATGSTRTGMPSATGGQTDERSAAGQAGGKVYQLMAGPGTNLATHVGHRIEVSGTMPGAGASTSQVTDSGVIKVDRVKMIAATCKQGS
jgi:hypothetical protein